MASTFETFGPFTLVRDHGQVSYGALEDFWEEVDNALLEQACGVYIIGTKHGSAAIKPWYVGQTHRAFRSRFRQHVQGDLFTDLSEVARNGDLRIFLIARTTKLGSFWMGTKKKLLSIRYLESALIGSCLSLNKKLLNVSQAKLHKGMCVPGYMNEKRGKPNAAARQLSAMLRP